VDVSPAPLPAAPPLRPLPAVEHPAGSDLAGKKVLVVDDDPHSVFALSALLKRFQVEVVTAERGVGGVELLRQTPDVDLALVDIMMPGMDGYRTMSAMRGLPSGDRIPLIAYTAKREDGEQERCRNAGASGYIPKPVDTTELLHVLGEWLPLDTSG
jgi:CheY-like chemotaxis protein